MRSQTLPLAKTLAGTVYGTIDLSTEEHTYISGLLKENLLQARSLGLKQMLLFTTVGTSHATLQVAKDLGMLATPYSWLMLNLVSHISIACLR